MSGVQSVKLLVVHHNTALEFRFRLLQAIELPIKLLQRGDKLNEDKCNS